MKKKEPFNHVKYLSEWKKEHMKAVGAQYKKEFVDEFRSACDKLGLTKSQIIRKAMEETIAKANQSDQAS